MTLAMMTHAPRRIGYDMPARQLDTGSDVLAHSRQVYARLHGEQPAPIVKRCTVEPPAPEPVPVFIPGPPKRRRPHDFLMVTRRRSARSSPFRHEEDSRIMRECAEQFGVTVAEMNGFGRGSSAVDARYEAFHRLTTELGYSSVMVGHVMGGRDHSTVLHGIKRRKERMEAAQQ